MEELANMSSSRPYLIRAMHEWIVDNGLTPYLLVDAQQDSVEVPTEFIEDGKIVLNVSPTAVEHLELGNDWISFQARFGGRPVDISIPAAAVQAIYGRETGEGMVFDDDSSVGAVAVTGDDADSIGIEPDNTPVDDDDVRPKKSDRSHLRVIK